jgi:uncharacterized membrane protein YdbT with pleckstrin-like domain
MLYVQQSLGPNEQLLHIGYFHWIYDLKAILSIILSFLLGVFILYGGIWLQLHVNIPLIPKTVDPDASLLAQVRSLHPGIKMLAFVMFLLGLLRYAHLMVIKITTEIAITNMRLILKRGLVARYVGEMSVDRIESVNVLQTFWGRILDYGQLAIHGMGVGEIILPPIANPIEFRKAIERAKIKFQDKHEAGRDVQGP